MWRIENRTPFAVGQSWTRDLRGAHTWIVIVKATFAVGDDGSLDVAADQPAVVRMPMYRGEPGRSSLRLEHDFCLAKSRTDVIVDGMAHAPRGRPATRVDIGLRVGRLVKTLQATGDRVWLGNAGSFSDPEPFLTMPVTYERAFGGLDPAADDSGRGHYWANPVGTGFANSRAAMANMKLPNVEYPEGAVSTWTDRPRPAGFGPIAAHWEDRARHVGTYDRAWEETRQPLLPADFDVQHWQSAPADQQASGFLCGGEPVALLNLTAGGRLDFALPTMQLDVQTRFTTGARVHHETAALHTVIIEPEFPRVSLVWHTAIECHHRMMQLDRTEVDVVAPGLWRGPRP